MRNVQGFAVADADAVAFVESALMRAKLSVPRCIARTAMYIRTHARCEEEAPRLPQNKPKKKIRRETFRVRSTRLQQQQ